MNREERRGLLGVALFLAALFVGLLSLIFLADAPSQPARRVTYAGSTSSIGLGSLVGRAVDSKTGIGFERERLVLHVAGLDGVSGHWLETESETPGAFLFRGMPAGQSFHLDLTSGGYETLRVGARVSAGGTTDLGEIRIRPLVHVVGAAVDASGQVLTDLPFAVHSLEDSRVLAGVTDSGGRFSFAGLLPGAYEFHSQDPFRPLRPTAPLELSAGGKFDRALLEVESAVVFHGSVSAPSGSPSACSIDAAPLPVTAGRIESKPRTPRPALVGFADDHATNAARVYWLSSPTPAAELSIPESREVKVTVRGARGKCWVAARTSTNHPIDFERQFSVASAVLDGDGATSLQLGSLGSVEILVLDTNGGFAFATYDAFGDFEVDLQPAAETVTLEAGNLLRLLPVTPEHGSALEVTLGEAATLACLPGARLLVSVPTEEVTAGPLWASTEALAHPAAAEHVEGQVLDRSGSVLEGVVVSLLVDADVASSRTADAGFAPVCRAASCVSDTDGRYRLPAPPTGGACFVRFRLPGHAVAISPLASISDTPTVLHPATTLVLRLVDEALRPIPDLLVGLDLPGALGALPFEDSLELNAVGDGQCVRSTDASGVVQFRGLPSGKYSSPRLLARGWRLREPWQVELGVGENHSPRPLRCFRPRMLDVQVETATGPLAGAEVVLKVGHEYARFEPQPVTSDERGSVYWEELPPPPYQLLVTAPGMIAVHRELTDTEPVRVPMKKLPEQKPGEDRDPDKDGR